jgi:hypothetical protein
MTPIVHNPKAKPMINLGISVSYTIQFHRNINTEKNTNQ